jgi:hypothetical protein
MLDFKEIKERVRIVDILLHYNVRLRCKFRSEYACSACPLPTHPERDKGNNCFCVHLPTNRFQCKHPDCGRRNGVGEKWGDCINLVMALDGLQPKAAAEKIAGWFPNEKAAPRNGERQVQEVTAHHHHHKQDDTSSSASVKASGYIHALDDWFNELFELGPELIDDPFWKERRNAVKTKCLESFNNGKKVARA